MPRKPKKGPDSPGFGEERQAVFRSDTADAASTGPGASVRRLIKIGGDGRVLIPADWREAMELKDNDTLVAHLEDGELRLHGSAVGLRKARAILRKYARPGDSVVDELIADRRQETRREENDG